MKKNNNKRTLILSLISILVCLTMLIGSTFAWFTDTASTAVNTIQSGTLDIDILHQSGDTWVTAVGQTLNFVQHECTNGRMLWEPGCTYDLEPVKVVNKGNLALKYKIELTGIDGNAELLEVIDWTVKMGDEEINLADYEGILYPNPTTAPGITIPTDGSYESGNIVISGHMREDAGNEYQNLSIDGIGITVVATQYAWECDSDGHDYDAEAAYPTLVNTTEGLTEALNNGGSVALQGDVESDEGIQFSVMQDTNLDFNGNTLKGMIDNGYYSTMSNTEPINLVLSDSKNDGTSFSINGEIWTDGDGGFRQYAAISAMWNPTITVESGRYRHNNAVLLCQLQNTASTTGIIVNGGYFEATGDGCCIQDVIGEIVINNGEFVSAANDGCLAYLGWGNRNIASVITINGGEFTAPGACFCIEKNDEYEQHIYITGGTFTVTGDLAVAIDSDGNSIEGEDLTGILVITGGTFNVDPTAYVDTENYTVTESEGTWTVTAK